MFTQAVKRKKMATNPCFGMDKIHKANPNANREWFAHEWEFVRNNAPMEVLIPCMIARHLGLARQTIVGLSERQFFDHQQTGKAVQYTRRKNNKATLLPVMPELQTFLADRKVRSADGLIAIRDDGSAWASEKEMQTRVSYWLRNRERDGKIGSGTTLHGLRVSYAAWWKRNGASDDEVARLIGTSQPGSERTTPVTSRTRCRSAAPSAGSRTLSEQDFGNIEGAIGNRLSLKEQKAMQDQACGRGGTGRRKGLKIPRWQRRAGSSPAARTSLRAQSE